MPVRSSRRLAFFCTFHRVLPAATLVLLHRFFCKQSFSDFDCRMLAASCSWLSMKLEEETICGFKKLNNIFSMLEHIAPSRRDGFVPLPFYHPQFKKCKEEPLEDGDLCFEGAGLLSIPSKLLLGYLNCLEASHKLVQKSWNLPVGFLFPFLINRPGGFFLMSFFTKSLSYITRSLIFTNNQNPYYINVWKLHSLSASFNYDPSHLSELSDKNHTGKDFTPQLSDISLVSSSSAAEILNAGFLNSLGRFLLKSSASYTTVARQTRKASIRGHISSVTEESDDDLSRKLRGPLCRKRTHIDEERHHRSFFSHHRSYWRKDEQKHRTQR